MRFCTLLLSLALLGCSSTVPRRSPVGETFPTVVGESLSGETRTLPRDLAKPHLLLVGYVQESQFDIDRWILGIGQLGTPVQITEVPTIEGMIPRVFAQTIDEGMRKGIPNEDWGSVVTVYEGAKKIVELTGNENPNNARVLLLDTTSTIVWFSDRGYSASQAVALHEIIGGEG